jgi:hypothetical protein
MKLDPRRLRAASLWAMAQSAERHQQWQTAYDLFARAAVIYEDVEDISSTHQALDRMYLIARDQQDWARIAECAKALIAFNERILRGNSPKVWLLVAQAERHCHNIEAARRALIQVLRTSEAFVQQSDYFPAWAWNTHNYVSALYEWALLEAETGMIREALGLLALGELTISQADGLAMDASENTFVSEDLETQLAALREAIISDRLRLQDQRS